LEWCFQGPTEKEQIDVQGDISYDIVEFITETWPDVRYLISFFKCYVLARHVLDYFLILLYLNSRNFLLGHFHKKGQYIIFLDSAPS
jgi:hypothetical protein